MTPDNYPYLLPKPSPQSQGWWDGLRRNELVVQECSACATLRHTPTGICPKCGSEEYGWRKMSGRGTVYSYIVVHQTALPMWKGNVPYNIALVALQDAPQIKMMANVIDIENSDLRIGMPVYAVFDAVTREDTLLRWRPAAQPVKPPSA